MQGVVPSVVTKRGRDLVFSFRPTLGAVEIRDLHKGTQSK